MNIFPHKKIAGLPAPTLTLKSKKEVLAIFEVLGLVNHVELVVNSPQQIQAHLFDAKVNLESKLKNKKYLNFEMRRIEWVLEPKAPHMVFLGPTPGYLFKKAFSSYEESLGALFDWSQTLMSWLKGRQFSGLELDMANQFTRDFWTQERIKMETEIMFTNNGPVLRGRKYF